MTHPWLNRMGTRVTGAERNRATRAKQTIMEMVDGIEAIEGDRAFPNDYDSVPDMYGDVIQPWELHVTRFHFELSNQKTGKKKHLVTFAPMYPMLEPRPQRAPSWRDKDDPPASAEKKAKMREVMLKVYSPERKARRKDWEKIKQEQREKDRKELAEWIIPRFSEPAYEYIDQNGGKVYFTVKAAWIHVEVRDSEPWVTFYSAQNIMIATGLVELFRPKG